MAPASPKMRQKPFGDTKTALPWPKAGTPATRPSFRKRKINPGLKDRAATFLSHANPGASIPRNGLSKASPAKRRKISSQAACSSSPMQCAQVVPQEQPAGGKGVGRTASRIEPTEKRRRAFRKAPPKSYLQKLERATSQRMIVLNRTRVGEGASQREEIELVGSTGNVYKVTMGLEPRCTCPDYIKGNQCKHIVYALVTVLKAPPSLQYQLAFLSSELREIFAKAPPIPTEVETASDTSGRRKPVDGECPICYMDIGQEQNDLVWCKNSCGNNVHKSCFDQWVASQRDGAVRCVYCRAPWQTSDGDLSKVAQQGVIGEDGYVNVAHLTGQSTVRDVSTYHRSWAQHHYYDMGF